MRLKTTYLIAMMGIWFCVITSPSYTKSSDGKNNSLEYIQAKADVFLKVYNSEHATKWETLPINPKVWVPECRGLLTAKWGIVFFQGNKANLSVERYVIQIICKEVGSKPKWTVNVPTTKPDKLVKHSD